MAVQNQAALVERQFGERADAYLASAVHAEGKDLSAISAMVRGFPQARALDLGCGAGHVSFAVAPHVAAVTACDLSQSMLDVVARAAADRGLTNISVRRCAAEELSFSGAEFDYVFSRFSAHHWQDFRRGIAEAARVLKPGGRAAFVDVIAPESPLLDTFLQTVELLRDASHVRDYARSERESALGEAGLIVQAAPSRRLRLDFADWVARMRTPDVHVQAIRSVQRAVADEVRRHFAVEPDGSFQVDTIMLEVIRP